MNMIMKRKPTLKALNWRVDMIVLLSRGVSISDACKALGISRATYYRHRDADQIFKSQVERARVKIQLDLIRIIRESNNWRAAVWLLETRYPKDWGRLKDRLRLHGCTCGAAGRVDPRTMSEWYHSWKDERD